MHTTAMKVLHACQVTQMYAHKTCTRYCSVRCATRSSCITAHLAQDTEDVDKALSLLLLYCAG